MQRLFFTLLILALGVWGYVALQVVYPLLSLKGGIEVAESAFMNANNLSLFQKKNPLSDTLKRDAFQSFLYAEAPKPVKVAQPPSAPIKKVLRVVQAPEAKLQGILWGSPPMAILIQDGRTEICKKGDKPFDLEVILIERHQVTVRKEGRDFILAP